MANQPTPRWDYKGCAWAVGVVAVATLVGWPLHHNAHFQIAQENILMLYLLGVLWIATHHSRLAAVLTSVLSVVAFDLTFVKPYYTLAVADEQYIVTFAVMLATALVISALTHRVRVHSEAARQAWERVEAEFLRNTLLSGVSHELRTPLSGIIGASSTLIESGEQLPQPIRGEMLETIHDEAERMERLITNLLDMTRLESGGMTVKKEWQPLQEALGSALHAMERRLAGRRVRMNVPTDLPLVQIDTVLIEQVLRNLLDNALEYTPAGSAIEINARKMPNGVEVEVLDQGPGLPAGAEQRVFEKFFRAAHGGNRHGIGLGLAICRGIIEAHGGMIRARNRAGGGAAFSFTLPATGNPPSVIDSAEEVGAAI